MKKVREMIRFEKKPAKSEIKPLKKLEKVLEEKKQKKKKVPGKGKRK